MKLILDFESRSKVDLRKRGAYVYAADPSTEVLCCAVKADHGPTHIWFPKLAQDPDARIAAQNAGLILLDDAPFQASVYQAEILKAHNAQFERLMWHYILHQRLGFPAQPIDRWQCTAAQAAALALPRSLEGVGAALKLSTQKDTEGHRLMLRMCKPQKDGTWLEDTESLIRLAQYCVRDVEAEYAVSQALPPLPASEQAVWQLDQKINDRGIAFDAGGAQALKEMVASAEAELIAEVETLTDGAIRSARQRAKIIGWLSAEGVEMEDLKKGSVKEALEILQEEVTPTDTDRTRNNAVPVHTGDSVAPEVQSSGAVSSKAKRMLEIRQEMSLSSVAKINTMFNLASADNRIRGSMLYHGASTGRWAGKGVQPHNFPRDSFKTAGEVELALMGIYEGTPIKVASKCLRGLLVPGDGKHLCAVDYSAIEARVLAWLANERHVLDAFRANLDTYKVAASAIYGVGYDDVTKDQRQIGKVAELALGYQGWIGAFRTMAVGYGVKLDDDDDVADEKAKAIIIPWRENRPATKNLWAGLEDAALKTVAAGKPHKYGRIVFGIKGIFLFMRLPSGRMLAYPYPEIQERTTPYGTTKDAVTFMGINPYSGKWERLSTYGGKLAENAVQAISSDFLRDGMLNLDAFGVDIVLHVHDEVVNEDENDNVHSIEKIMSQPPAWAADCPLAAEGWIGTRYKK